MEDAYYPNTVPAPIGYGAQEVMTRLSAERLSYRKRVELEAAALESKAKDLRKIVELFDRNPDLEETLNVLRRLGI